MQRRIDKPAPFGDSSLASYAAKIAERAKSVRAREKTLCLGAGSLANFACAHEYYGLHLRGDRWIFREWAPNATSIELVGDFNGWRADGSFALARIKGNPDGAWEGEWPQTAIRHGQRYHLVVRWNEGGSEREGERIPAYARRVVQDPATDLYEAQVWQPTEPYRWRHPVRRRARLLSPFIYEAHVGMAQDAALHTNDTVGSYRYFSNHVLPRIRAAGYTDVQLMVELTRVA